MIRLTWFRSLVVAVAAVAGAAIYAGVPEPQLTGAESCPDGAARQAELQVRGVAVARRIAYKEQLVAGLVERRYGLDEVAREFLDLIREDDAGLSVLRLHHAGSTDEVRAARNVIDYVRSQPLSAREAAAAVAHLRGEFRRLYPSE